MDNVSSMTTTTNRPEGEMSARRPLIPPVVTSTTRIVSPVLAGDGASPNDTKSTTAS
jgi:hypothetical protein